MMNFVTNFHFNFTNFILNTKLFVYIFKPGVGTRLVYRNYFPKNVCFMYVCVYVYMYVCMYICLSFHTHMSKVAYAKSSLCM